MNRLYTMDLPNGTPKRITTNNFTEAFPAWSQDGTQLAWVTWEGTGGNIYKINFKAKGAKPVKLTQAAALYSEPAWYGNKIVFLRGAANNYRESEGPFAFQSQEDLLWMSGDGGTLSFIAKSRGRATPHFTKSSDRIYLYSGGKGLVSIRWDGTDEKAHLKVTGITTYGFELGEEVNHCMLVESATEPQNTPSNATVLLMAPEGDQVLAKINNDIYVVTLPLTGGETPKISVADASSAAFPARKLTKLGGEFPGWSSNAKNVYFTLGNAFFTYNLDSARAKETELKKKKAEEEKAKEAGTEKKEEPKPEEKKESDKKDENYKPNEIRIKVNVQKDIPTGKILLQNARLVTMKGDEVIERG
ncbi:MAG TPA: amidohydrolase, partial [Cyclobacteriaceae bacterium]|nr:amidohydrolase [Cyclobacteriaceae bacterium]